MYLLVILTAIAVAVDIFVSLYRYNSLSYDCHKLRLMFNELNTNVLQCESRLETFVGGIQELNSKADIIRSTTEMVFRQHTYSNKTMRLVLLNTRQMYSIMNNGYKSKYIKHNVFCSKTINARHSGKYAKNEPSKAQLESLSNLASDKELEDKGTTVKLEGRNATTEPKTGQESKDSTDNIGDWL